MEKQRTRKSSLRTFVREVIEDFGLKPERHNKQQEHIEAILNYLHDDLYRIGRKAKHTGFFTNARFYKHLELLYPPAQHQVRYRGKTVYLTDKNTGDAIIFKKGIWVKKLEELLAKEMKLDKTDYLGRLENIAEMIGRD